MVIHGVLVAVGRGMSDGVDWFALRFLCRFDCCFILKSQQGWVLYVLKGFGRFFAVIQLVMSWFHDVLWGLVVSRWRACSVLDEQKLKHVWSAAIRLFLFQYERSFLLHRWWHFTTSYCVSVTKLGSFISFEAALPALAEKRLGVAWAKDACQTRVVAHAESLQGVVFCVTHFSQKTFSAFL